MSGYECDGCGETFDTLTAKRLHDCPDTVADLESIEVTGWDEDQIAEAMADKLLTCRECAFQNPWADDLLDVTKGDRGFHLAVQFVCERCGTDNQNEAAFEQ